MPNDSPILPTPNGGLGAGHPGCPIPRTVLLVLRERVDLDAVALEMGLAPQELEGRLTLEQVDDLYTRAWERIGDPTVGFTAGRLIRPELFGILGYPVMHSPDFGTALARISLYKSMAIGDRFDIEPRGASVEVSVHPPGATWIWQRWKAEYELSFLVAFGRYFTGRHLKPERLEFRHAIGPELAEYVAWFGCPVIAGAPADRIRFAKRDLALPLISAQSPMADLVSRLVQEEVEALSAPLTLAARVAKAIREEFKGAAPTIDQVAHLLVMSRRSLQRGLQKEGTGYQEVVDRVRQTLAEELILEGRVSTAEISYLLGFENPTSFFRAFRRWTGLTPGDFLLQALARQD